MNNYLIEILRQYRIYCYFTLLSRSGASREKIIAAVLEFQAQHVTSYGSLHLADIIDISSDSDSNPDDVRLSEEDSSTETE